MQERSEEKELIDMGPSYYTAEEYLDGMKKLFIINRLLGFFRSTVTLLKTLPKNTSIVDIGCGDGLFLLNLNKRFPSMQMLGIDVNQDAIALAKLELRKRQALNQNSNTRFEHFTENTPLQPNSTDVVMATLVCHHIADHELVNFLRNAYDAATNIVVINDLHRHRVAYILYYLLSPLFRNRLITHDGLISIKRGFTRRDWHNLLSKANITHYKIKWLFPFRWTVILWKK